jgi:hypothetical protein
MTSKTWREALDEHRELDGDDEYALLFHGDHPAGHIFVAPGESDETEVEVGTHPKEWIPTTLGEVEAELARLGLSPDGWE